MGSLNIAKCLNSSSNYSESMTAALFLCLLAFQQASLAPQYADQTNQELFGNQLDVFGDSQVEEAHSAHTVKNEAGYTAPHDYQEASIGKLNNVATTEVDNVFENCADYTASQGYECVPYYQCNNGTIITDGEGLIDIRNGFGILSPEDSKCPGFLDLCKQGRPVHICSGWCGCLGDWLWGGRYSWGVRFYVKGGVLDRLCHELSPRKNFWGLLKLLGPLSPVPGVDGWRTEPVEQGGVGHAECGVADRKKEGEGLGHRGQGAEHVEPLQPVLDKLDLVQLWKRNRQSDL